MAISNLLDSKHLRPRSPSTDPPIKGGAHGVHPVRGSSSRMTSSDSLPPCGGGWGRGEHCRNHPHPSPPPSRGRELRHALSLHWLNSTGDTPSTSPCLHQKA